VTVRTEHPEILEPIVVLDAVDVVELNAEVSSSPFCQSTVLAPIFKYTSPDQAVLDMGSRFRPSQHFGDRHAKWAGRYFSSEASFPPAARVEAEFGTTLAVGVPFIVIPLDLGPIVLAPAVTVGCHLRTQLAAADRLDPGGVREPEPVLTFYEAVPLVVEPLYLTPIIDPSHSKNLPVGCASRQALCSNLDRIPPRSGRPRRTRARYSMTRASSRPGRW
jgi:hypothetical protein